MKKLLTLSLTVMVLAVCRGVYAQPPELPVGPPGALFLGLGVGGLGISLPVLLRGVDLTTAQQASVKKIMADNRTAFIKIFGHLNKAQEKVSASLFAPGDLDMERVGAEVQDVAQLQMKLLHQALDAALQIRAVLTSEQLKKAAAIHKKLQDLEAQLRTVLKIEPASASP